MVFVLLSSGSVAVSSSPHHVVALFSIRPCHTSSSSSLAASTPSTSSATAPLLLSDSSSGALFTLTSAAQLPLPFMLFLQSNRRGKAKYRQDAGLYHLFTVEQLREHLYRYPDAVDAVDLSKDHPSPSVTDTLALLQRALHCGLGPETRGAATLHLGAALQHAEDRPERRGAGEGQSRRAVQRAHLCARA